ncbi:MAG: flagellar basal body L-ring protein FlgH [Armatimonadota bacterium]|nr:flagellar basal body L-ring protein FlgH [Armatimonadota bacterium]MDR7396622.1 flagellar basal body L-ring protein FlgH [Armatimonadota bacterium]MDR7399043.1 flagellar basal body L-ring protein FlgH [Armatimonadota bacterium]MDR7405779.1 flagellar basal body L-ring protein FlgH [Armatimonadota bacterium]MDR7413111.1 flagellar basal body L-ring protein FlgH [Armatimonadota bacterium]
MWRWLASLAVAILVGSPGAAQSLWPQDGRSLFTDHKASEVGDLVTVVVNEAVAAQTQSRTSQARSVQLDLGGGSGFLSLLPGAGFESGQDASSSRAVGSTVLVQARVTLRVAEVLPNGVLRLEGDRTLLLRDEPYRLRVSGLVRRLDVQADNTVSSDRLADVRIVLEGPRRPFTGNNPLQWVLDGFGALLRFLFSWLE